MKLKLLAALLALAATPAAAQRSPSPPARPRLVIAISVDQFSDDLFAEYRGLYQGGLRRLSQGMVFPAGYQSHSSTETCPGHSTILTGARPARTGIIANNWYDQGAARTDKYIYCSEDENVPGSTSENYTVSPLHLRVPTLGDLMQRADPRSRVVAVAGKDRAAVMMGGHNPTQRWYWGGRAFVSDRQGREPGAVTQANNRIATALTRPREAMTLPDACAGRSRDIAVPGRASPVGSGRFARGENDRSGFRASPDFDRETLAIAEGIRDEMRLGEGPSTDLLIIGLSATDYVGHGFGTRGSEMCIQVLALDRILGEFFQDLDRQNIDYVVVLTADHGGLDLPERAVQMAGGGAARVDPALNATRMSEALARRLGVPGPVILGDGSFGDMWVVRSLSPRLRTRVLAEAIRTYRAHPQVQAVFTRTELLATPNPAGPPDSWTLIQRARASFDPRRSGDFYVMLRPRITPIADPSRGSVATHGSVWDYDRRVPILFWRRGMTGFEQPLAVETVDIMPSLAGLIGLPLAPGSVDGRCLDLIAGPETSCPN
ncbi:MAG TPA: alkaline phosphatase family protein [Allosphingosinicella sp.]|nr:alkaline phosphatase family protein [Allosphingosinicella sp.]